jgi:hypothetical protein
MIGGVAMTSGGMLYAARILWFIARIVDPNASREVSGVDVMLVLQVALHKCHPWIVVRDRKSIFGGTQVALHNLSHVYVLLYA